MINSLYFFFLIILILVFTILGCTEDNENSNGLSGYSVTYHNPSPGTPLKYWVSYAPNQGIVLDPMGSETDDGIQAGDYRLEYKIWDEFGNLSSHKNGHFVVNDDCTINIPDDLDDIKEGGFE